MKFIKEEKEEIQYCPTCGVKLVGDESCPNCGVIQEKKIRINSTRRIKEDINTNDINPELLAYFNIVSDFSDSDKNQNAITDQDILDWEDGFEEAKQYYNVDRVGYFVIKPEFQNCRNDLLGNGLDTIFCAVSDGNIVFPMQWVRDRLYDPTDEILMILSDTEEEDDLEESIMYRRVPARRLVVHDSRKINHNKKLHEAYDSMWYNPDEYPEVYDWYEIWDGACAGLDLESESSTQNGEGGEFFYSINSGKSVGSIDFDYVCEFMDDLMARYGKVTDRAILEIQDWILDNLLLHDDVIGYDRNSGEWEFIEEYVFESRKRAPIDECDLQEKMSIEDIIAGKAKPIRNIQLRNESYRRPARRPVHESRHIAHRNPVYMSKKSYNKSINESRNRYVSRRVK